jgi:Na+-driven multidrug efflux pump
MCCARTVRVLVGCCVKVAHAFFLSRFLFLPQYARIMWIALIFVGSLSGASSINMSLRLGRLDPNGARQAGYVGIAMSTAMLLVLSVALVFQSRSFGRIFTNDPLFLEMWDEVSLPFSITLFFMNLAVAIEKIPYSMGRTTEIFWMGLFASWGGTYECEYCMGTNKRKK